MIYEVITTNERAIEKQKEIKICEELKKQITIPEQLKSNMFFSSTSLGGLFLSYFSNIHKKNVYKENSKSHITLYFDENTRENKAGFSVSQFRNMPKLNSVKNT